MKGFAVVVVLLLAAVCYAGVRYFLNVDDYGHAVVLRVGVECDYPPNNWEENKQTNSNVPLANNKGFYAEGYDIQIAKTAAKSMGAKLELKKLAWNDLIPALNRNEIDVIFSGMLDTSARKELIAFTESYQARVTEYAAVVQKSGKWADAKKLTDFEGARFVAQVDSNFDAVIEQLAGSVHLPPVNTPNEMLEELLKNKTDGIITDIGLAKNYVKEYSNLQIIVFPKGESFVFDHSGICAGVRKSDEKLLNKLNEVLNNISPESRQKIMRESIARSTKDEG